MDVTNENFLSLLPEITETIAECDFIAIDTELSGLLRDRSLNRFDLPEERFSKAVGLSRGYFIMQFGLSCFKKLDELKYSSRTYNFYIFPQAHKTYGDIDRTFSLQAHAIQFLSEHNFDFNKLFRHGVSYLTYQEKKVLQSQLKDDMKARSNTEFDASGIPKFVPISMAAYCQVCLDKVKKFVEERREACASNVDLNSSSSSQVSANTTSDHQDIRMQTSDATNPDRLELRDCNSNHRRVVMKRVMECCPFADNLQVSYDRNPETNEIYVVIEYLDKKVKTARQRRDLVTARGFLEVMELIIVHKKPLVGHNLSLDLIQIINQFIEPLGNEYNSFKEICHALFPIIYDTKHIANEILDSKSLTHNQTRLNDLYCQLKDSSTFPKIEMHHVGESFDENQAPHQAGYDAYMSGFSFIALCEAYVRQGTKKRLKQTKMEDGEVPSSVVLDQRILDEFANKVHLSYSYDYKYYDLDGVEPKTSREHVFYVEFPSSWTLDDIFQLFHQYGGVEACKLNNTSALCALRDPKRVKAVMKIANARGDSNYRIHTYAEYLKRFKKSSCTAEDDDVSIPCP